MNNKPTTWKLGDDTCQDEFWIAYVNPVTGRIEYWKHSNTGKQIYSVAYAKKCLAWYALTFPDYSKMWIEPAFRYLS